MRVSLKKLEAAGVSAVIAKGSLHIHGTGHWTQEQMDAMALVEDVFKLRNDRSERLRDYLADMMVMAVLEDLSY